MGRDQRTRHLLAPGKEASDDAEGGQSRASTGMSGPLKIGVVPRSGARPPGASLVGALEELGVASLWAPGHILIGREVPEAITGLATLAVLADHAVVGTAVLVLPLYHPVIVAKQVAELDRMTDGRVALGVGVGGEYPEEFAACQMPLAQRGARTDEAVTVMRRMWTERHVDHDGRFWSFSVPGVAPPPARSGGPPVLVAGRKPAAMRRAASLGDGWMPFLYSAAQYADSRASIVAHASAIGRDLAEFHWTCFVYVSIDDDSTVAREKAMRFIGAGQAGDPSRFRRRLDQVAAAGDPGDVRAALQAFVDAGVDHFIVMPCEPSDQLPMVRRLMRDVVPELDTARRG
jgi:alkanesulfonate monooxygenase SsuD/methylene tetrahydromethanopterin reductase-like flavin-dependent oxidoreductase (luciferase family)